MKGTYFEGRFFCEEDLRILKECKYDPSLEPSFEILKCTLIWWDEYPGRSMTSGGNQLVYELWIARTGLYYRKFDTWPGVVKEIQFYNWLWEQTKQAVPSWPGFVESRLHLSKKDQEYYDREFESAMNAEEY